MNKQQDFKELIYKLAQRNVNVQNKVEILRKTSRNDLLEIIRSLLRKDKK